MVKPDLVPVMNNTKWEELRTAMCELEKLSPQWQTKDIETGYICQWDGEWFYHFSEGGYETIEWVNIKIVSQEQKKAVLRSIVKIHVPGEETDEGFRVYGYLKLGQQVDYLK